MLDAFIIIYIYIYSSGWWYTYLSEKYESQIGSSSQLLGKIKVIKVMFQTTKQSSFKRIH